MDTKDSPSSVSAVGTAINKGAEIAEKKLSSNGSDPEQDVSSTRTSVHRQEFLWDSIIQWLVAAIFGLTLLDVSASFFRNYTISCHVETTIRDEVAYVNSYCYDSLPQSEYFTLYVIIHGFLLIGPHVLWKAVSEAYINYFFDLCNGLDRLRDRLTGDYAPRNSDIVSRLLSEFKMQSYVDIGKWKLPLLFGGYILKLVIQALTCIGSIVFSAIYFHNFPKVFPCPKNLDVNSYGWHLNMTVTCVYPSIHFMALLQYGDFILMGLILMVLIYAFVWVIQCHPKELGQSKIAEMCSQSCLRPNDYTYTFKKYLKPRYDSIKNDMDFLLMMLFRASSGKGATLKEMLIKDTMNQHYGKNDELLQLFLRQREGEDSEQLFKQAKFRAVIKDKEIKGSPRYIIETKLRPKLGLADDMEKPPDAKEISKLVKRSELTEYGFNDLLKDLYEEIGEEYEEPPDTDPPSCNCCECITCCNRVSNKNKRFEKKLQVWCKKGGKRKHLRKVLKDNDLDENAEECIGEAVSNKEMLSFQNQVYRFLQLLQPHTPEHNRLLAMDVSFDGLGCTYILEWALESVCSVSFNSHFHNQSEPIKREKLYNQITLIRLPQEFFWQPGTDQTKLEDFLDDVFFDSKSKYPRDDRRRGINDKEDRYINFFTIGPMKEDAKRVTVNLLLESLHDGHDIADNCLMLAIRPLKIGGNIVADKYFKYVPSYSLFKEYGKGNTRPPRSQTITQEARAERRSRQIDNEDKKVIDKEAIRTVGMDRGIVCYCAGVECVFEMELYHYTHKQERDVSQECSL